ncbi:MAG: type I glyceraldehyde-3-phosphate dehydrogenase [Elusimicrobiaceae bacterium]|nr:type I glyceraldehyde-3-phosphate dehydrogenase [Elusimicrobiaceae bacterium]MBT3954591.1 type I glyceraldehyde-3-phosphate dehydrogenase [Elusimicrobiaceae bacterium]MBT4007899.1 type I glyceraldehyde-3-phosphate dehydrogenase [Elusimicrobiaceae bacterium]MBT4439913.1 type I glyceraldehyde-3-phosphate dehydrogenase [Elusimicrobiaceae bacterium]MBT5987932.1 type I glyceraldehyde-3-phosphate dehydrogenase [Elusimicrobiaceae bacterium]
MAIKVAINGFGRIGRLVLRAGLKNPNLEFVAVNDLSDAKTMAHLFKYDSTFGIFDGEVKVTENALIINGKEIKILAERNPADLPWKDLGVDIAIESTGIFTQDTKAQMHLDAGAKKVIISAPGKGDGVTTICMGINEEVYNPAENHIISNASCTTNCLAPVVKVLEEKFGIVNGLMTTIHSYTNDQPVLDFAHKDLRRARAAAVSMIPTTTGAAKAIGLVMPNLKGKLNGYAMRVPTPNVSVVDLTVLLKKETTKEEINKVMKESAEGAMKGVLEFNDVPLVSKDFNGNPNSSIFDAGMTDVIDGNHAKILAWYDNEWGYSNRVIDLTNFVGSKL